jgi:hypothetical protein
MVVFGGLNEVESKGSILGWWPGEILKIAQGRVCFVVVDGGGERVMLANLGILEDFVEVDGVSEEGDDGPDGSSAEVGAAMIGLCAGQEERRALVAISLSRRGLTREEISAVSRLTPNLVKALVDRFEATGGVEYARTLALPAAPSVRLADRISARMIVRAFEELHAPVFDRLVEHFSSSETGPERQLVELPTLLDLAGLNDLVCVMLADRLVVRLLGLAGRDPECPDRDTGPRLKLDGEEDGEEEEEEEVGAGGGWAAEAGLIRVYFAHGVDVAARGLGDDMGPRMLDAALKSLAEDKSKDAEVRARAAEELAEMLLLSGLAKECLSLVNEAVAIRAPTVSSGARNRLRYARALAWQLRLSAGEASTTWAQVREVVAPLLAEPRTVPRGVAEEAAAINARAILSSSGDDQALLEEADRAIKAHARPGSRVTLAAHAEVLVRRAGLATSKLGAPQHEEPTSKAALDQEREDDAREAASLDALHVAERALAASRAYAHSDGHPLVRSSLTYLAVINESLDRWERAYLHHHQLAYEVNPHHEVRQFHLSRLAEVCRLAGRQPPQGGAPFPEDPESLPLVRDLALEAPGARISQLALPRIRAETVPEPPDPKAIARTHRAQAFPTVNPLKYLKELKEKAERELKYLKELKEKAERELAEVDAQIREAIARKDVDDLRGLTRRRVRLLEALQKIERK